MSQKVKVLVFPCGSENATEIYQALRYSVHVELIGASSVDDYGRFRFDNYVGGLPRIDAPDFDAAFAALLDKHGIDMVFATHDTVLDYLATRAARMGFFLVNGDAESASTARRKSATYRLFADQDWVPAVFDSLEQVEKADAWPVIVKPDLGQGAQGVTLLRDLTHGRSVLEKIDQPVLCEYLPGDEITVDCFTDRKRRLVCAGPRTRERIRAGITMRSHLLESTPDIDAIARTVNDRLILRGPWFFQLKKSADGKWKLLEISCRVAGTMVAQRARGRNLPLMAVQDFLGRDLVALTEPRVTLIERCIATRAELDFDYESVYVDLDDTLVIDGSAVPHIMAFLYQARRDGKRLILITRHAVEPADTLRKASISDTLFDEVIHIRDGAPKSRFVTGASIFIDNHFPERMDVARVRNIPVFDVDAIEFLTR